MDFRKIAQAFAPMLAIGLMAATTACSYAEVTVDGEAGQKLEDLDTKGATPHKVTIIGPDSVKIEPGDHLAIRVEGDKDVADKLRFFLKNGQLAIARAKGSWGTSGTVTVHVTMPAPDELTVAGSGNVFTPALARKAKITIAGSGDANASTIAVESLALNIAGSGSIHASGTADSLDLTVAGSGSADLAGLKLGKAQVSIAGSGDAKLTTDGEVKASIVGSGSVYVKGRARCEVNAVGSGKLVCQP